MTDKWIKDTGLVLALMFLVAGLTYGKKFLVISMLFVLVSMLVPKALYPLAFAWFKFAGALNLVVPKIFFSVIFFMIILPIGILCRVTKGDMLLIAGWREAKTSFVERNNTFSKKDIETPY